MTLYRQLLIFTSILFLFLFVGTYLAKLYNTRSFLENQLESHATDTATSLGLSLSPYMAQRDVATMETMINAIFDHGYYRLMQLTDMEKNVLIERKLEVVVQEIPSWFIAAVPLHLPKSQTLITSGWSQTGYLYVESHPGYAYKSLWKVAVAMAEIFLATCLVVAVLGGVGLQLLLRPLRRVEEQAEALCNRKYTFQERLPRTRELRRVVVAMNSMTSKVKQMFTEQAHAAEQLHQTAYSDSLTGLGNRRYLEGQVEAAQGEGEGASNGAFLLVELRNLMELNKEMGYEYGDIIVKRVAELVSTAAFFSENHTVARLSGGGFALLLPTATGEDAEIAAGKIADGLATIAVKEFSPEHDLGHVGGICYDQPQELSTLLAAADRVLRRAQSTGANTWRVEHLSSEAKTLPAGEQEWRRILEETLAARRFRLFAQKVVMDREQKRVMQLEIFSRIALPDGRMQSAGIFIPLAERLECIAAIDQVVLEMVFELPDINLDGAEIAVNISPLSLDDVGFSGWLLEKLRLRPAGLPPLVFEFAEFNATRELDKILDFATKVRQFGAEVGIDHFGKGFVNFGYLQSLRPRYVKVDRAFTAELLGDTTDSQFFITALTGAAHSLDIMVIAEGVENEKQFKQLADLKVDGIQGYHIDTPKPLGEYTS